LPNQIPISLSGRKPAFTKPARKREMTRSALTAGLFIVAFVILGTRLVSLGFAPQQALEAERHTQLSTALSRPAITDRAGRILATDIITGSLYANPSKTVDLDDTVEQLSGLLPGIDPAKLRKKLSSDGQFQWIARKLGPRKQAAIHELGLPGIGFTSEPHRVYPAGAAAAHILGHVDIDNKGLAGIETYIDRAPAIARPHGDKWQERGSVALAMDLSVQHAVREEMIAALRRYKAKAAAGLVLDIHSGEIVSLVSLPDYDPNKRDQALAKDRYNRVTSGVFELGSVFKMFTVAAALDVGAASLSGGYDAREPIRVGGHKISDFHAKKRWLSVPEIFIYSSNIGSAKMALDVGVDRHKAFLRRLGLLSRLETELGSTAAPILPANWRRINTMTIAFGHGMSVTPLQMAAGAATLLNGGYRIAPAFLKRSREEARVRAERVVKPETSELMRYLFRLNVKRGSGKRADARGYRVGGKTGTAEKVVGGRYSRNALLTSFVGAFPMEAPEYVVLVMLDEPKGTEETGGRATAGVNAAAVTGRIVERIGPMLGIVPRLKERRAFDVARSASY